ncbi:MAG TPA: metallophosphoesterase [Phycisphaerae bacterium]|nr:metallophosphoesterase [Phycisphaerae bacterium]
MTEAPHDWDINPEETPHGEGGEIIDRLDRAAILSRRDPLRRGNVVHLPDEGDAIVVGDIHGDMENFHRVIEWAALHRHKNRYLILQELIHSAQADTLGEDQSFRLLESAAELKCRYPSQVQMILSNHDLGEMLGSVMTKCGKNVSAPFWRGIENTYGKAWPEVHGAYRRLLTSQPLAVRTPTGVFISHSTPQRDAMETFDFGIFDRPLTMDDYLPGGSVYNLVWGRNHNQESADWFAQAVKADVLVTGHQPSMPGVKTPTTRHIILTSDGPLGRCLPLRLNMTAPYHTLVRQAEKIRSLEKP